jgi:uncharacterized protein (DUF433 family)
MPAVPRHPRISIDTHTCFGKPRITDTRISVDLILRTLAESSTEWLLEGYPDLTREDVAAALAYASDAVAANSHNAAARILALQNGGRDVFTTLDAEGERSRALP